MHVEFGPHAETEDSEDASRGKHKQMCVARASARTAHGARSACVGGVLARSQRARCELARATSGRAPRAGARNERAKASCGTRVAPEGGRSRIPPRLQIPWAYSKYRAAGEWRDVESGSDELILLVGDWLSAYSRGAFHSAAHRVLLPDASATSGSSCNVASLLDAGAPDHRRSWSNSSSSTFFFRRSMGPR